MCEIDFDSMDPDSEVVIDALSKILSEAIEESERYEQGLPHLMICSDLATGYMTFSGPFNDRSSAQQVAARESHDLGAESPFVFRIAPLYPPLELRGSLAPGRAQPDQIDSRPRLRRLQAVEGCGSLDPEDGAPPDLDSDELDRR